MRSPFRSVPLAAALAFLVAPLAAQETAAPDMAAKTQPAMRADEAMPTGMKREGMTKGEVRRAAAKKAAQMKEAMEKEAQAMPAKKSAR
ncbi:MAG: hypothetical protein C0466_07905 [Candidatus Accumulibacter sp.]|nr:hypothetical protein [Accumulibacter sp.]